MFLDSRLRLKPIDTELLTRRVVDAVFQVDIASLRRLASRDLTNAVYFKGRLDQRDGLLQFARGLRRHNESQGKIKSVAPHFEYVGPRSALVHVTVTRQLPISVLNRTPFDHDKTYLWQLRFSRHGKLTELRIEDYNELYLYPAELTPEDAWSSPLSWIMDRTSDLGAVLYRLRALLVVLTVFAALMLIPAQSGEALRVLIQTLGTDAPLPAGIVIAAIMFSVTAFSYGLIAFTTRRDNDPNPDIGEGIWSTRLLLLTALVMAFWIVLFKVLAGARLGDDLALDARLRSIAWEMLIIGATLSCLLFKVGEVVAFRLIHLTAFVSRSATFKLMSIPTAFALIALGLLQSSPMPTLILWWSTVAITLLGWLTVASIRTRIPFVAIALIWPLLLTYINASDHHLVAEADGPPSYSDARATYRTWLALQTQPIHGRLPVFIVSAEGGGIRAAVVTAMVLDELRSRYPEFRNHLFAVVGVSGGAVGAASFAAALQTGQPPQHPVIAATSERQWQAALHTDLLAPTIKALLTTDLASHYVPTAFGDLSPSDRNTALESSLARGWLAATGKDALRTLSFSDIAPRGNLSQPNLILMTTSVSDGEPMAVSHLSNIGTQTLADRRPNLNIPLTTAAMMSARFPLVSTAARLPGDPPGTGYVDGGYFENSGITATLRLIRTITKTEQPPANAPPDKVFREAGAAAVPVAPPVAITVIRIENGEVDPHQDSVAKLSEVLGPVLALYGTRGARAAEAARTLDELISSTSACDTVATCTPVHQVSFKLSGPATIPLGWQLSARARTAIAQQIMGAGNCAAFEQVGHALGVASSSSCEKGPATARAAEQPAVKRK